MVRHLWLALILSLVAGSAQGAVCRDAVALRVNNRGLAFIASQVRAMIPDTIEIPAVDKVVVDWPLTQDDARVVIPATDARVSVHTVQLAVEGGALKLYGKADVVVNGPVEVRNPYASFGSAQCRADVQLRQVSADLALTVTTENGIVKITAAKALLDMDNNSSVTDISGCALGSVLSAVVRFVRSHFASSVNRWLQSLAERELPPFVERKLAELGVVEKHVGDLNVHGTLSSVGVEDNSLALRLALGVVAAVPSSSCIAQYAAAAPVATCSAIQPRLGPADAMFAAGLPASLVNRAMDAVWRAGKLCIDSNRLEQPSIAEGVAKLVTLLGQPVGTQLVFSMRLAQAPSVTVGRQAGLNLELRGISLQLDLQPPNGPAGKVVLEGDMSMSMRPWIDPKTNSIGMQLGSMQVMRMKLRGADPDRPGVVDVDPARMQRFLEAVAMPLLAERLGQNALSPAVINAKEVLVHLRRFDFSDGYLAAHVDAYDPRETPPDHVAPTTALVRRPPGVVAPQVLELQVGGKDDQTPSQLLRFRVRVDGGAWSAATFGGVVRVPVSGGVHHVEVAAVDLKDNVDPTPERLDLVVDDISPQLQVHVSPPSLLEDDTARVSFSALDDRTLPAAMKMEAQLWALPDGGGTPRLLTSRDGNNVGFSGLVDGVYRIRMVAQDEAGNVTSKDVGFVVDTTRGCAVGNGSGKGLGLTLLLLGLMAAIRRRR